MPTILTLFAKDSSLQTVGNINPSILHMSKSFTQEVPSDSKLIRPVHIWSYLVDSFTNPMRTAISVFPVLNVSHTMPCKPSLLLTS